MEKVTIDGAELNKILARLRAVGRMLKMSERRFAIVLTIAARVLSDEQGLEIELRGAPESGDRSLN